MADECSIEELTAFLEASDEESERIDDETVNEDAAPAADVKDEIGEEDIEAFLGESDDDEEGDEKQLVDQTNHQAKTKEKETNDELDDENDDEFDDMDLAELEEMDSIASQSGNATQSPVESSTQDSNNTVNDDTTGCPEVDENLDVKSEMAAMAARIKQLEAMLTKKAETSVSSEKHKSKKSPRSDKPTAKSKSTDKSKDKSQTKERTKSSNTLIRSTPTIDRHMSKSQSKEKLPRKSEAESSSKIKYKEKKASEALDEDDCLFSTKADCGNIVVSPGVSNSNPRVASPETTVDAKTLFGESDDSDWDELDGGEKTKLSEEGRELKKLLTNGPRKREAHTPSYDPSILKKPDLKGWTEKSPRTFLSTTGPTSKPPPPEKPALDPKTGTVSGKYKLRDEYKPRTTVIQKEDERASVTDPFCGIRIINPRISMEEYRNKMAGRNIMKIPQLLAKAGTSDLQKDNWVTMGVVVHKTEPRQSASGKTYCIWKLSDLQNCDRTVTFFLFGNVYRDHWKNDLGVVIGLLNPSLMDKAEKAQSEVAFTINHPGQLLVLGISKDLGRCRGTTKAGHPCSSFINKMQGEYCTYHVQAAYRKSSSKRTELQASTGVEPKNFQLKKNGNNSGFFFYGGNTFSSMKPQAKATKDKMNLQKLQSFENKKSVGKVTTMSLHELQPQDKAKLAKIEEKDQRLLELLAVPTAGAMNFVKHLVVNKDGKKVAAGSDKPDADSVSAKDLLKKHQDEIRRKKIAARKPDPLKATPTLGKGFSFGQEISLDVPVKKSDTSAAAELKKQLAIAKVKSKGGIQKEDPNAVRKNLASPEAKDKIKKRVAACMEDEKTGDKKTNSEPPRKKSKFLGDLDLNSPEVQSLLKSKSKHTGALAEAEAEHEDKYFSALEQKERMEDKMAAIMEVPVTLVMCLQCKYKYFSLSERCKKENHPYKKVQGTKRFFKCKQCKRRSVCLDKIPTNSCKDCGATSFERVSMLKERSGPKLESEELCIRGNEQKFVGSLQGKAFLNV